MQTLTFRLNINECLKYQKSANLFNWSALERRIMKCLPVSSFSSFEFKCYCIINLVYVYQVTPSLTWIGIFFSQNCFYFKLLIIMFIRMFDVQYWNSNNIYNTWKRKKRKTKNLNVVYVLKRINGLCNLNFYFKITWQLKYLN